MKNELCLAVAALLTHAIACIHFIGSMTVSPAVVHAVGLCTAGSCRRKPQSYDMLRIIVTDRDILQW
jgi:hypothetical protein